MILPKQFEKKNSMRSFSGLKVKPPPPPLKTFDDLPIDPP